MFQIKKYNMNLFEESLKLAEVKESYDYEKFCSIALFFNREKLNPKYTERLMLGKKMRLICDTWKIPVPQIITKKGYILKLYHYDIIKAIYNNENTEKCDIAVSNLSKLINCVIDNDESLIFKYQLITDRIKSTSLIKCKMFIRKLDTESIFYIAGAEKETNKDFYLKALVPVKKT